MRLDRADHQNTAIEPGPGADAPGGGAATLQSVSDVQRRA
jgi:hypothetical protein